MFEIRHIVKQLTGKGEGIWVSNSTYKVWQQFVQQQLPKKQSKENMTNENNELNIINYSNNSVIKHFGYRI